MKINHLGFFNIKHGQHQGRYVLLEFRRFVVEKGKRVIKPFRVGVRISPRKEVEIPNTDAEFKFDDLNKIAPADLVKMIQTGRMKKLQEDVTIALWTSEGLIMNPDKDLLPERHFKGVLKKARELFSLPSVGQTTK